MHQATHRESEWQRHHNMLTAARQGCQSAFSPRGGQLHSSGGGPHTRRRHRQRQRQHGGGSTPHGSGSTPRHTNDATPSRGPTASRASAATAPTVMYIGGPN